MRTENKVLDQIFDEIISAEASLSPLYNLSDPAQVLNRPNPLPLSSDKRTALNQIRRENRHREARAKDALADLLGDEGLFRFAHIPCVISELIWDYADTITTMAAQERRPETKALNRRVKALRREYVKMHDKFIGANYRDQEIDNMLAFEDAVKGIINTYQLSLRSHLTHEYSELGEGPVLFLTAVYHCFIVIQALLQYADKRRADVERLVGHSIGNIVSRQVRELALLVPEYAGDKRISQQFISLQRVYIKTLANQMGLIQMVESRKKQNE